MAKTDKEIIEEILNGNASSFESIVERYQQTIFLAAIGILQNVEDAEDAVQETFVNAFVNLSSFRNESSLTTWLYRIAINKSLELKRKRSKTEAFKVVKGDQIINNEQVCTSSIESSIITKEKREIFQNAISKLPGNQRTAIILSRYNELSNREVSEVMKISEKAVESLLHRAKENLKKIIKPLLKSIHH